MRRTMKLSAVCGCLAIASLYLGACSGDVQNDPVTGVPHIIIKGDDGQVVDATDLEGALKQAMTCLANAQDKNDPVGIKDWKKVIDGLIEEKQKGD